MKVALITGASGGIGKEIAIELANKNYSLILVYNTNEISANELEHSLQNITNVLTLQCNLTRSDEIEKLMRTIWSKYRTVDVLVNCAGISLIKQIQDITADDYTTVLDSNLKSATLLTTHVSKKMIAHQYGRIINISSIWGQVGSSMESVYSASKGALNAFTLALAKELGPSGITVNAVCPGLIETKMNTLLSTGNIDDIVDNTPIGRIGTPEDVARLVTFLADEDSDFITGQIIAVDGGLTL